MNNKTLAIVLVAVAAFAMLRVISQWRGMSRGRRRGIDWDEHFIQQLRKAGVDTFAQHPVEFFFTLPSRQACDQLAVQLRQEGFHTGIRESTEAGGFILNARRNMRLVVAEMQALTTRFNELAQRSGGKYDNWAVAKEQGVP